MRSFETTTLVQYLRDCAYGNEIATFQDMSELIQKNVQYGARSHLSLALAIVLRDYGFVFQNIRGLGYRVLVQQERSGVVALKRQSRIRGETTRWRKELETVDVTQLPQPQLKEYISANLKLCVQEHTISRDMNRKLDGIASRKASITGLDFAKEAALALHDVS